MTYLLKAFFGLSSVFAQSDLTKDLPGSQLTLDQLFVKGLQDVLLGLAVVAFLALVWAGIMYITAGGDPAKAEKARKSILWTLLGVVLAVLSYGIVVYVTKTTSTLNLESGSSSTTSAGRRSASTVKSKMGTKSANGSYYNPCVSETPDGCIDSDGFQTGLKSDGTVVGDTSGSSGSDTTTTTESNAHYGISIVDPLDTLSADTMTITDRTKSFNNPYGVQLNSQPAGNVTVAVTITGSLALRLSDSSLTFTAENFSEPQGVNVQYLGGGRRGQSATVTFTGSDGSVQVINFVIP